MTDKLQEARASLLQVAQTILAVLKEGSPELILLAADSLEGITNTPECKLQLEAFEARRSGLN